MIQHALHINGIIYDIEREQWGIVTALPGNSVVYSLCEDTGDDFVEIGKATITTNIASAYPLVPDRTMMGERICLEINKDTFDADHDYDYFCPERSENCWEFETELA